MACTCKIKYTDVAVIGNGPSAISLSYMLAGNWPYYTQHKTTDGIEPFLHHKLLESPGQSLLEQDMEYLSEGLEGRSSNPLALLYDHLTHPGADVGLDSPSTLSWQHSHDKSIPHIVIGKGLPGGAWQAIEGVHQTLSLGNWMEMPNRPMKDWKQANNRGATDKFQRASVVDVKDYYSRYVKDMNLEHYFYNHATVTSVRSINTNQVLNKESGEIECCAELQNTNMWEIKGTKLVYNDECGGLECVTPFTIRALKVVLASGTCDMPNRLNAPGEQQPYVLNSLAEFYNQVQSKELTPRSDPVLIVGSGLSAADAILLAISKNIPVLHTYRKSKTDPSLVLRKLPKTLYPEYHDVYKMMSGDSSVEGIYQSYDHCDIKEITPDRVVILKSIAAPARSFNVKVSAVLVVIGSKPDLSYLEGGGRTIGIVPDHPIDCKYNPVSIDQYSHQCNYEQSVYAMGPLVGDNFVRFVQGGALGIMSNLWKVRQSNL